MTDESIVVVPARRGGIAAREGRPVGIRRIGKRAEVSTARQALDLVQYRRRQQPGRDLTGDPVALRTKGVRRFRHDDGNHQQQAQQPRW